MNLALVKVEAPSDFAFSTLLGIVSRKIKMGEIWLYLKGSKLLTIKHPNGACSAITGSANRWKAE